MQTLSPKNDENELYEKYLQTRYTQQQLEESAQLIQSFYHQVVRKERPKLGRGTSISRLKVKRESGTNSSVQKESEQQVGPTDAPKKQFKTQQKIKMAGFGSLLREIQQNDIELSNNRQKKLINLITSEFHMSHQQSVLLRDTLFLEQYRNVWHLHTPSIQISCPLQIKYALDDDQQYHDVPDHELRNNLLYLNRILFNNLATKAMSLILKLHISSNQNQYQIRLIIRNFIQYLDEIDLSLTNRFDLMNNLLDIYIKQNNLQDQLHLDLKCKVHFIVTHHLSLFRSENGYKLMTALDKTTSDQFNSRFNASS